MRIPLIAGRTFAETDDSKAPAVIILSQSAAKKFFPGEDPIGKRLLLPPSRQQPNPAPLEVIGVVGDVPRNGLNAVDAVPGLRVAESARLGLSRRCWSARRCRSRRSRKPIQRAIWEFNPGADDLEHRAGADAGETDASRSRSFI